MEIIVEDWKGKPYKATSWLDSKGNLHIIIDGDADTDTIEDERA